MLTKLKERLLQMSFSFQVAWQASKIIFFLKVFFECYWFLAPILTAYLFRQSTNALVSAVSGETGAIIVFIRSVFILVSLQTVNVLLNMLLNDLSDQHTLRARHHIDLLLTKKVNELDISFFDNPSFYKQITQAKWGCDNFEKMTSMVITVLRCIVQIIAYGFILGRAAFWVPLAITVLMIPSALFEKKFFDAKMEHENERIRCNHKMTYVTDILQRRENAQDLRILHTSNFLFGEYERLWQESYEKTRKLTRKKIKYFSVTKLMPNFITAALLILVGTRIINGEMSIGDYAYYQSLAGTFIGAFSSLIATYFQTSEAGLKVQYFMDFLKTQPFLSPAGSAPITKLETIEFRHVSFAYPGTDTRVLEDICFELDAKKVVALVGKNGAGKTSLIKLLLRLYEPDEGTILINGRDIREYDPEQLHLLFGVMFQRYNVYLFTLRDNIAMSNIAEREDDEQLKFACANAQFDYTQDKYFKGFDTYIGSKFEDGAFLSGGEEQKMSIAQAYFKRQSAFYVLDEPNSALDAEAEDRVFSNLKTMTEGKGALFVTHRMTSATISDYILVLDKGKLVESGSHKELMEKNGLYANLFKLQAMKYQDEKKAENM